MKLVSKRTDLLLIEEVLPLTLLELLEPMGVLPAGTLGYKMIISGHWHFIVLANHPFGIFTINQGTSVLIINSGTLTLEVVE